MIPVKGHSNLFRNEKTNAIVNVDTTAYETYMNNRSCLLYTSDAADD